MSIDQLVQTQLQMAQAFGALNDTLTNTPTMEVSTRDVATTLTIPDAVTTINVGGVTTVGDGQAGQYIRVAADPGSVEKFQSADGSWFQLATPTSLTGSTTISAGTSITAGTTVNAGTAYQVSGTQVVGTRITGWGVPTGSTSRGAFNTATVTTADLAARVASLINDLKTHGLLGT